MDEHLTSYHYLQSAVVKELAPRVRRWKKDLLEVQIDGSFTIAGALKCGHFRGRKPSRNPVKDGLEVVEVDYRLLLSSDIDPQSKSVTDAISEITGLKMEKHYNTDRWDLGRPTPQSIFYGYFPVETLLGEKVEVELSVQRAADWCEISDYWSDIFTPAETEWQAVCRQLLRLHGFDYDVVGKLKGWQCDCARWRILAGFASGLLKGPPPELIRSLVSRWNERPYPETPEMPLELPAAPGQPDWVKVARAEIKH